MKMTEAHSLEAFVKKLEDYGLTSHEIDQLLNALRVVYISEAIGYWGGIPSGNFNEIYSNAVDMLVRLGLIERTQIIEGRQAYRCSSLGNILASNFILKLIQNNREKINSLLNQFPPKLVAFWSQYGFSQIDYGKFEGKAMKRSKNYLFELFDDTEISVKLTEIWNELEKIGLAVGSHDNVSTRGGELREHKIILPPEFIEFLRSYPYPHLRTELGRYKIFRILDDYSKMEDMSKSKLLKSISDLKIDISEIKNIVNEMYELGITTKYLDSELVPFLIRKQEQFLKFIQERYLNPIKDSIMKEAPIFLADELEMKPEKPFTNLNQVYEMIKNLEGTVVILDKDFGYEGLNFFKNLNPTKVKQLKILISKSYLGRKLRIEYKAFHEEMKNAGIIILLRILNDEDASIIHDRYLIDNSKAYNTPPWNIIHKKFGDIKRIEDRKSKVNYFKKFWNKASKI